MGDVDGLTLVSLLFPDVRRPYKDLVVAQTLDEFLVCQDVPMEVSTYTLSFAGDAYLLKSRSSS